ncbi:class I SAM-dependent methyltransferase [Bacillus sp. H-16]|uniref:class I SAM-dependent methyltransferase n=1 Tax=Alteribacter salitolerans TaxID=2912333 RepID=UPI001965A3B6|nr:class I SAM-dependent methyltransferase [Alteribacter salitolerans]MBM7096140.1 class I SAM-dependent methyltransferase [Alteribacter salitolerans]
MLNYYSTLSAEVYDMDKPVGHSFGDIEFYAERLAGCRGPILEPAAGTGRILIPLLEKGFDVEGFDVSREMLAICEKNGRQRGLKPSLFKGEMETFTLDKSFEVIVVPTGTFLLLHEREASLQALKNFYDHLEPGGRLILDLFLPEDFKEGLVSTRSWEKENGDIITLESKTVEVDRINQYSVSYNRYERWHEGRLVQTELERFCLRWYGVEEFRMVLKETGFTDIVISADYEFGKYPDKAGQVMTFEAVK